MPIFTNVTDCRYCPCRSDGAESGCGLEYKVVMEWMENKELIECSHDCELYCVVFGSKDKESDECNEFNPDKTITTPTAPGEWGV